MNNELQFEDDSNDRKYFSLLPHYILNHSTAIDQSLYMQMKRYAGENQLGECFASKNTLKEKMGIGEKALNKSIQYLIKREWIYEKGFKKISTKGGEQQVKIFGVKDIWKMNTSFYEGGAESRYPYEGGLQSNSKVVSKVTQGGAESRSNKNHTNKNHTKEDTETSSVGIPLLIKSFEKINPASKKFYAVPVQRQACASLIENYGLDRSIAVVENTLPKTNSMQFFPTITTPLQLWDKWAALESKVKQYQHEKSIKSNKYKVAF